MIPEKDTIKSTISYTSTPNFCFGCKHYGGSQILCEYKFNGENLRPDHENKSGECIYYERRKWFTILIEHGAVSFIVLFIQLVFAGMKVNGLIDWKWYWVLSPLIVIVGVLFFVFLFAILLGISDLD